MKMAKWIIAVSFLALAACGDEPAPCGGYGCHTTYTDEQTGVSIRYDVNSRYTPSEVVALYQYTVQCTDLSGDGPIVLFVADPATDAQGRYLYHERVAIIYPHPYDETAGLPLSYTIIHEFVHHLLEINGMDSQHGPNQSPLFVKCALH